MSFTIGQPQQSGLDLILGQIGQGAGAGIHQILEQFHKDKELKNQEELFKKQGYTPDLAKLAASATTGGQTEVLKHLLEMRQRGTFDGMSGSESEEIPAETEDETIGLTPSERVKREEQRFSKQSEKYGELSDQSAKIDQEGIRLQRLQELNEGGGLPEGLGRLNVNLKSGELIAPFLGSADSQEFVKIINDFLSGAKDTFGARVTNFEVNRFLRRLPSLLNTAEGRRRVLRQMEIINQLNKKYNQEILDEFDRRGGVRKIDYDVAIRAARKKIDKDVKSLQREYVTGKATEEGGKELTEEIAKEIFKEAKQDPELARKIAKKRGYEF